MLSGPLERDLTALEIHHRVLSRRYRVSPAKVTCGVTIVLVVVIPSGLVPVNVSSSGAITNIVTATGVVLRVEETVVRGPRRGLLIVAVVTATHAVHVQVTDTCRHQTRKHDDRAQPHGLDKKKEREGTTHESRATKQKQHIRQ